MKGTDFKNSHTNQGNEIFEPFDDCFLARHAKSFGQRSGNRSGFDFAIAVKNGGFWRLFAGKLKRMGGAQLTLLVGIIVGVPDALSRLCCLDDLESTRFRVSVDSAIDRARV